MIKALLLPLLLFIGCSSAFLKSSSGVLPKKSTEKDLAKHVHRNAFLAMTTTSDPDVMVDSKASSVTSSKVQYELSTPQLVYVVLTSIFITCLLIADVIGVKLFEIPLPFEILGHKTVEHTCGMLTFPITFMLGDTINEYYGAKATKQTVYIGLAMSILTFFVMNVAQAMPYLDKPFNVTPDAFNMIFGSAKLMYIASVSAYFVGQMTDIWLFGVIKKITKGALVFYLLHSV